MDYVFTMLNSHSDLEIWRFKYKGKKSEINLYEASYGVSVFYYGAYLLNTQAFEFRYLFPSWILLFGILIGLTSQLLFNKKKTKDVFLATFIVLLISSFVGGGIESILK